MLYGTTKTIFVGIDEVGRGAWAGPVVAAAVILPYGADLAGLNDSKQLSAKRREQLDLEIRTAALAVGLGWVTPSEVDAHGLSWAVRTSGERALADIDLDYNVILLDGSSNYLAPKYSSRALVHGDAILPPVAAASIVAKVARDNFMIELDTNMPEYGFGKHKGYGTAAHSSALKRHGVSVQHRRSYRPVKVCL